MIQIQNLVKDYGDLRAVDNIKFEIKEGEIVGFLGPNGAGKSTTLKIITGYLSPTVGNIQIKDFNILDNSQEIRELIGYLPEHNPLYTEMTVYDYLKFIAEVRKIPESEFSRRLKDTIAKCGLKTVISKPINTLSKGYRQRVGLAQAIIHDPKILILDEPTTGLDPNQIVEIRDLIKSLGKEKTLIISSHILQEVKAVCDRIIIINKGKIVADKPTKELEASFRGKTKIVLEIQTETPESIDFAIPEVAFVSKKDRQGFVEVVLEYDSNIDKRADIYNYIKNNDWTLLEMKREYISLEEIFRNLTVEKGAA
ncbi:MAG: ATP-binding cassette domain-containing protein [Candidatus Cloacimonetes bacterium]|nr:ATP-binding cassette domain-containing protein [Candidatus Cloacimonadota bacterium]